MILPDVNVLIYAFRKDVPQHPVCRAGWTASSMATPASGSRRWRSRAVVRITTNVRAFKTPSGALKLSDTART